MKIGLIAPAHKKETGGGFTYMDMVMNAVPDFDFGCEVVILDYERIMKVEADGYRGLPETHSYPDSPEPPEKKTFIQRVTQDIINKAIEKYIKDNRIEFHKAILKQGQSFSDILNRQLKDENFDLLWIVTPMQLIEPCIPYAITVWDLAHRFYPFFPEVSTDGWLWEQREHYYRSLLPKASYIFTGAEHGKLEIAQCYGIPFERIRVLPLPAPRIGGKAGDVECPIQRPFILYPAQFWAHKNHVHALRALSIARTEHGLDLDLVFLGSDQGNEKYVRKVVADEGLTEVVHFLGFVGRPVLEELYRRAAALLYLSFFGPDNLPPLEAFSCRCPVIVSDHPGHREQLGQGAMFVDPLDAPAVANAIRRILTDSELRTSLADHGVTRAQLRTVGAYLQDVKSVLSEFAAYRSCWGNSDDLIQASS